MKPFILILLAAVLAAAQSLAAGAQSLAEVARQERERQERVRRSQVQPIRVFTNADVRTPAPAPEPGTATDGNAAVNTDVNEGAPESPIRIPAPLTPLVPDPAAAHNVYNERITKLRAQLRDLRDQETARTLQVNTLTNAFFSPVTNSVAQREAQDKLGEAKKKLEEIQKALTQARVELEQELVQGPPKQ